MRAEARGLHRPACGPTERCESQLLERKRIQEEANRKRSEAVKGNDNATKERAPREETVVGQSVLSSVEREPTK